MSLQDLVNNFGVEREFTSVEKNEKKSLKVFLYDNKYKLLINYLNENGIYTTGDLKSMSAIKYNMLKSKIPAIQGVGQDRTDLYINKLDEIRNSNNKTDENSNVYTYGIIGDKSKWHIEINKLSFNDINYIDIRKIGPSGERGKGISIKFEDFEDFKSLIEGICLNEDLSCNNNELINEHINVEKRNVDLNTDEHNLLKQLILDNENRLIGLFDGKYDLHFKLFKKKIESFVCDGDIVKFLNNPNILDIKKEQYDTIHSYGYKTAIDIMNSFNKENLVYTKIENLKIGDCINTLTICAMVNNFNHMLGMYYNDNEDYIVLKSQIFDGEYSNKWLSETIMLYFLQNEKEYKYNTLDFSHKPNQICRDIILGDNLHTKVYLFCRDYKNDNYVFCGEYKPIKFVNSNKCIEISKVVE